MHSFFYPGISLSTPHPLATPFETMRHKAGYMPFLATRTGLVLFDKGPVSALGIRRLWVINTKHAFPENVFTHVPKDVAIFLPLYSDGIESVILQPGFGPSPSDVFETDHYLKFMNITDRRILLPRMVLESRHNSFPGFEVGFESKDLLVFFEQGGTYAQVQDSSAEALMESLRQQRRTPAGLLECTLGSNPWHTEATESPLSVAWMKYIPSGVIPYDEIVRRQLLRSAYEALAVQIAQQEQILGAQAKALDQVQQKPWF
jgi:hypothetical protein